jgi:glycosyltransferase involved in cell wall biosynthesis
MSNSIDSPQVLVLLSDITFGGIAVQAKGHAEELYRRRIGAGICLLNGVGLDGKLRDWYTEQIPLDTTLVSTGSAPWGIRVLKYFMLFKRRSEAIFHFHCFSQEFINWQAVLAAKLAGKTVVATLHHTVAWTRNRFHASSLLQRLAWKVTDKFIVTTDSGKDLVGKRILKNKISVIPCHVPQGTTSRSALDIRKELGFEDDDFVIVSVARLVETKGLKELVSVVGDLGHSYPKLKLIVIGEGPCYALLREIAGKSRNIRLLGKVETIHDFLQAANLFALPSYEEGFGIVYVEAAHHGLPAIASALPQVKEVVVDGETGWLVTPGNVNELKDKIVSIQVTPEECLRRGQNAMLYCRKFLPEVVIQQIVALYR